MAAVRALRAGERRSRRRHLLYLEDVMDVENDADEALWEARFNLERGRPIRARMAQPAGKRRPAQRSFFPTPRPRREWWPRVSYPPERVWELASPESPSRPPIAKEAPPAIPATHCDECGSTDLMLAGLCGSCHDRRLLTLLRFHGMAA